MKQSSSHARSLMFIPLFAGIGCGFMPEQSFAVACRDIQSVQQSANPDQNTAMGGHVTQHIYGMRPPSGTSQNGKTLFSARGKYEAVWKQYQYITNPVNCGGNQAQQTVPLSQLGISNLDAYSCKTANAQGECTSWDSYIAQSVFFGFILNGGTWILNTAFPVPLP